MYHAKGYAGHLMKQLTGKGETKQLAVADFINQRGKESQIKSIEPIDQETTSTTITPVTVLPFLPKETKIMSSFQLTSDVSIDDCKTHRAGRTRKYPFGDMQPGVSFHVPATPEQPQPQKTLAGAVSGANKTFKSQGLKFSCRTVGNSDPAGAGCRVFCLSLVPEYADA